MAKQGYQKVNAGYRNNMHTDMPDMSTPGSDKWYFLQRQDPNDNTFYKPQDRSLSAYREQRMVRRSTGLKVLNWRCDSRADHGRLTPTGSAPGTRGKVSDL